MTTIDIRGADQTDIQLIRMQQQVREIAKEEQKEVIGVEQTPNEEWVIVSKKNMGARSSSWLTIAIRPMMAIGILPYKQNTLTPIAFLLTI